MIARLVESRLIGPDVKHFVFEIPELDRLEFTPGQFISFSTNVMGKTVTRAYSLAGTPEGNRFELCMNRVQEGVLSPYLFSLEPGATLPVTGPLGFFVPREPFLDAVFIATGTGIAPFRGFLRSARVIDSPASVTLLYGARYEAGLVYLDEFRALEEQRPGFRLIPTITRPDIAWNGRTGRVQAHLDEALAGRADIHVYLCGLKAMVDDVRATLKSRGFDRKQIIYEKYD